MGIYIQIKLKLEICFVTLLDLEASRWKLLNGFIIDIPWNISFDDEWAIISLD